jgi:hypothetical protein
MRQVHHAGDKCFVDYAGQKPRLIEAATGEVTEVTTPQVMLRPDEDALAVMKWRRRLQSMTPGSRWYPVLQRYIDYLSARVTGLGGDPGAIPPSPTGAPVTGGERDVMVLTGKVIEIIYDCFGRLEAFVLNDCGELHTFKTREPEIGRIALRACRDHLLLSVYVDGRHHHEHRIRQLVIRR